MPKSSRAITPKASSKKRPSAPVAKSSAKAPAPAVKKAEKNGHKNGHKPEAPLPVNAPSRSLADAAEKDAKGVQAVWTGQPERQERLRDLVKLAKD